MYYILVHYHLEYDTEIQAGVSPYQAVTLGVLRCLPSFYKWAPIKAFSLEQGIVMLLDWYNV